jgi:two-component system, cell cycle response regulator
VAKPEPAATLVGPTLNVDQRKSDHRTAVTLPTIRVAAGPDMLKFATLYPPDGRVVVGRDTTCDLTLTDGSVSRRHAAIRTDESGGVWVEDLGSTNGTSIDGQRLAAPTPLEIGQTLHVGGVTMRLERLSLKELSHLTKVVQRLSLANKDALTGLVTRHYLDDELPALLRRHRASAVPVSALFVDVDHFKRVNDTWGHAVGDDVLRTIARLLVMNLRDSDTCVRYGGEEFVAILPNCDVDGAVASAERLRRQVERHDWSAYAEGLAVTVSAGAAEAHADEDQAAWLERADRALYEAKATGRNRTVAALTPGSGPRPV